VERVPAERRPLGLTVSVPGVAGDGTPSPELGPVEGASDGTWSLGAPRAVGQGRDDAPAPSATRGTIEDVPHDETAPPATPATPDSPATPAADPTAPLRTVGWVHVRDGRLLTVRSTGKDRFFMPGGKVEPGETDEQALVREIREELGVRLDPATVRDAFVAEAPGHGLGGRLVRMHCLYADPLPGSPEPAPHAEIAELAWLTAADAERVPPAGRIVLERLAAVLAA